jgi:hypothetical protein
MSASIDESRNLDDHEENLIAWNLALHSDWHIRYRVLQSVVDNQSPVYEVKKIDFYYFKQYLNANPSAKKDWLKSWGKKWQGLRSGSYPWNGGD